MHTAGSARQLHSPSTGTVAVGKRADLMVLDRDIESVPVNDIRETVVTSTLIGGRVVYDADSAAARKATRAADGLKTATTTLAAVGAGSRAPGSCCGVHGHTH